jgi:hypothetical protein
VAVTIDVDQAQRDVHSALDSYLDEGEICVGWTLTMDVVGPDEVRYLAHRAGGGVDGTDAPTMWTACGMLKASADVAADQLRECTTDCDDEDED